MPTRHNYNEILRPKREIFTKEFADDERPEITEKVCLRYLNAVEQLKAGEKANELIKEHITDAAGYPLLGGEPATLTESLFRQACSIEAMQPPSEDGYFLTAHELIAMAHTVPSMYLDIVDFATKVNMGYDPKALGVARTELSSASALTAEQ